MEPDDAPSSSWPKDEDDGPLNNQQFGKRTYGGYTVGQLGAIGAGAALATSSVLHRPDIQSTPVPLPAELPKGITGRF